MVSILSCLFLSGGAILKDNFMACLKIIKDPPKSSLKRYQKTRLVFTTLQKLYFTAFKK